MWTIRSSWRWPRSCAGTTIPCAGSARPMSLPCGRRTGCSSCWWRGSPGAADQLRGKIGVSLCLIAVGAAPWPCRQAGRPAMYALLALALPTTTPFSGVSWTTSSPTPGAGSVALADCLFDQPFTARSWLALAGVGILFYTVHLQFLLLFAGAVAGWRSAGCRLAPAGALAFVSGTRCRGGAGGHGLRRPALALWGDHCYELRMRQRPPCVCDLGQTAPGAGASLRTHWKLGALGGFGLLLAVVVLAVVCREEVPGSRD